MAYNYWVYNSSPSPGRLQINNLNSPNGPGITSALNSVRFLYLSGTYSYNYSTNKTYQIIVNTIGFRTVASFSFSPSWNDFFSLRAGTTASSNTLSSTTQSYIHYSTPPTFQSSTLRARISANGTFSNTSPLNPGITGVDVNELDFSILGYSYYKRSASSLSPTEDNSLGWYYDKDSDKYFWYDYVAGSPSNETQARSRGYFPVGNTSPNNAYQDLGYRLNNALYKFIPFSTFNFSFLYQNIGNSPLNIYLSTTAPNLSPATWTDILTNTYTPPSGSVLLATIPQGYVSGTYSSVTYRVPVNFYGVTGNKYLIFVGGFAGASASNGGTTYSAIYIENLKIDGGYHPGNNRQYLMSNFTTYSIPTNGLDGAGYSFIVGNGNTVNATSSLINPGLRQIFSKVGNGKFKAGIWENGVWNSGWRVDENMYVFHSVSGFVNFNRSKRWRLQIKGPASSVSKFNIGDNVAISNVVSIDINEDRKLIKGYFTITNKTTDSIIVEFDNNFPLRRVERDSDNHRIYVTKNVWLSGGFLNGYFTGIWNYGLFKGYPLITEMYNSHWIDGIFDGGHFYSEIITVPNFVDAIFSSGNVGLTFSTPHGLVAGDIITIDKDDKTVNPQYDGECNVTAVVNNYQIVTDISYGIDVFANETGKVSIEKSKGLVQKVNFKSNNISKITSVTSAESNAVFIYNSWMDVVYDNSYATNIGKPQSILNRISRKSRSENNLYGYITKDVLESISSFRDSFSNTIRSYKLGTKYKIFSDFIGDAGNFEEDFGFTFSNSSTVAVQTDQSFLSYGWTYSSENLTAITFSRVQPNLSIPSGEQLKVQAFRTGGILDITPTSEVDILNRTYGQIQKLRYTIVEYDLVTYSNSIAITNGDIIDNHQAYLFKIKKSNLLANDAYYVPPIHLDNINYVKRNASISDPTFGVLNFEVNYPATYLPIYQNVNPFLTKKQKKVEYFYNKRNLGMHFYGYSNFYSNTITVDYVIDNLHFYEVDMIPFFQYFTENNINKGIAIPYQGLSPFIDYSNSGFVFIDNISIGLDSIQTQNSNTVLSGVGIGNSSAIGGDIYVGPGGAAAAAAGSGSFSDIRLKENIIKVGLSKFGINIYEWNYIGNKNRFRGVIAQELLNTKFEKSLSIKDGFYWVDYSNLDVNFEKLVNN